MLRMLTAAAAVLATAGAARAQYGCYGGYGGPPVAYGVAVFQDGRVKAQRFVVTYQPQTATAQKVVNDNGVPRTVQFQTTVMVVVQHAVPMVLEPGKLQVTDAGGARVGAAALEARLKKETPVLLALNGQELDPRYRRILKPGVLVLHVPRYTAPSATPPAEPLKKDAPASPADTEVSAQGPLPPPTPAAPDAGAKGPRGPQPALAGASIDKGTLYVRESSGQKETQTAYREVVSGGAKRKVPVRVRDVVVTTRMRSLAPEGAEAYRADGTPISAAALPRLLAKEVPALVSLDGRRVDPFYLQIIRGDTLILVLPTPGLAPAAVPPNGAPPPPGAPVLPERVPPPPSKT